MVVRKRTLDASKFKKRLEEKRDELVEQLRRIDERTSGKDRLNSDVSGEDFDEPGGDAASETFERSLTLAQAENTREELEAVLNAIRKIDKGTYGVCDSCQKNIKKERLEFIPWATMCTDCRGRMSGR